jgi:hypothetical protein
MIPVQTLAKELNINAEQLLYESFDLYLKQNLYKIQSEMFSILKKFDVKDIYEFDEKIKSGTISESEGFEDFFKLDNLSSKNDKYNQLIALIND